MSTNTSPEAYRRAAKDRALEAGRLWGTGQYGLAYYLAGLAVECILRAYKTRIDPQFDARHNLHAIAKGSGFYDALPGGMEREASAHMATVYSRWRNDHRYRSEADIRGWLKTNGIDRRVKGDILKESSHQITNAAFWLVTIGDRRWDRKR